MVTYAWGIYTKGVLQRLKKDEIFNAPTISLMGLSLFTKAQKR